MTAFLKLLSLEFAVLATGAFLFWFIVMRAVKNYKKGRKRPFTKSLLNNPGESSFKKLEELNDQFTDRIIEITSVVVGFIGFLSGTILHDEGNRTVTLTGLSILAFAFATWLMFKVRENIRERMNYRLGYEGEQHTAQALSALIKDGYSVFHDLPFTKLDGTVFNIDHVLFGPAGVIAIETKTRSKDLDLKGHKVAKVLYDGKRVQFPKGTDTDCLDQAKANAKSLSKLLTRHTGESVSVSPVVCLPGWYVTQTVPRVAPYVCNPDMVAGWIGGLPNAGIAEAQALRIRAFLEDKATIQVA